jgi:hypothetical protein
MKMLFQMPSIEQRGLGVGWRCAGCDMQVRGTEHGLPAFCAFCGAWAQWRRQGDELWAQALNAWEDDGGWSSAQYQADRVAARQ